MKLFCYLISLVFVHVSTFHMTAYKMEVFLTNAHIEQAYSINNCLVEDIYVTNGLEHVIKTIVYENRYDFGMMNNMIAVPEHLFQDGINVSMEIQRALQREIEMELKIKVPEIPDEITFEDFGDLDLTQLAEERRRFTGKVLKDIMSQALDTENLAGLLEQRELRTTANLENRIGRVVDRFELNLSVPSMCRFLALFLSTKFPTSSIKFCSTGFDQTYCTIGDGITADKVYRSIEGEWWQVVGVDDINKVKLLKEQLSEN